jgi:hypothetical protein
VEPLQAGDVAVAELALHAAARVHELVAVVDVIGRISLDSSV